MSIILSTTITFVSLLRMAFLL